MTVITIKAVPKDLIDTFLADYKKPEDLIGENGLLKQLTKLLVERALNPKWRTTCSCGAPFHQRFQIYRRSRRQFPNFRRYGLSC